MRDLSHPNLIFIYFLFCVAWCYSEFLLVETEDGQAKGCSIISQHLLTLVVMPYYTFFVFNATVAQQLLCNVTQSNSLTHVNKILTFPDRVNPGDYSVDYAGQ